MFVLRRFNLIVWKMRKYHTINKKKVRVWLLEESFFFKYEIMYLPLWHENNQAHHFNGLFLLSVHAFICSVQHSRHNKQQAYIHNKSAKAKRGPDG